MEKVDIDNLFGFVKFMFEDKRFNELSILQKTKHVFMVNRFMSIKYPLQAEMFNRIGINSLGVIESWNMVTCKYNRVPRWIFTKTKKNSKNEKKYEPDPIVLDMYLKINEIGMKDYNQAMTFFPEKVISDLKILEDQMESSVPKVKKSR